MSVSINAITSIPGTGNQVAATDGLAIAIGSTAQRLLGVRGAVRLNSTTNNFEATPDGITYYTFASATGPILSITGTANQITVSAGVNPVVAIASNPILPGTGGVTVPTGTTGQRAGGAGTLRYNSTTSLTEVTNDGATWAAINTAASSVDSVSGTANRITSTGGNNPVIDISAAYVGQTSITTLGTITTGVWAGTAITEIHGGTNQTTYILGDTLYSSAANTLAKLAGNITAVKQYLSQTGTGAVSAAPIWATIAGGDITGAALTSGNDTNVTLTLGGTPASSLLRAASITAGWAGVLSLARGGLNANLTANTGGIFYSTATAGAILAGTATALQMLQSGATAPPTWSSTSWPATSTINQILYSSAANVISGLATANSATLATSSSGVPSLVALAATQVLVGTSGTPAAAYIPGRNICINGDFQIWQRGAGGSATFAVPASTTQYIADRWQVFTGANEATTVTQTAGATSGSYLCTLQRNNAQTGTTNISITSSFTRDMCIGMAGNKVTVSFKVKAGANFSAASSLLGVFLNTGTGSTDISALTGFTGSANPILTTQAITTTLTQYSITSAAAIGATVTQAAIQFYFTPVGTAGADDSFSITDVQVEISTAATPYDRLPFQDSLRRCQYFFCKSYIYTSAPAATTFVGCLVYTAQIASTVAGWTTIAEFPISMRAAPTLTYYNPNGGNTKWRNLTGGADSGTAATAATFSISDKRTAISNPQAAGDAAGNEIAIHYSADIDLV